MLLLLLQIRDRCRRPDPPWHAAVGPLEYELRRAIMRAGNSRHGNFVVLTGMPRVVAALRPRGASYLVTSDLKGLLHGRVLRNEHVLIRILQPAVDTSLTRLLVDLESLELILAAVEERRRRSLELFDGACLALYQAVSTDSQVLIYRGAQAGCDRREHVRWLVPLVKESLRQVASRGIAIEEHGDGGR